MRWAMLRCGALIGGFFVPFWAALRFSEQLPAWSVTIEGAVTIGVLWALIQIGLDLVITRVQRQAERRPVHMVWRAIDAPWREAR